MEEQIKIPESELLKFAIVLEGGGTLGTAEVGALVRLNELGLLKNKTHFGGASVGAMLAGLLACKAPIEYIENQMMQLDYKKILDDSLGVILDMYRLTKSYGWYKGDYIESMYGDMIEHVTGNRYITLKEIHDKYGTYLMMPILLNYKKTIIIDHISHPDWVLVKTIRKAISMQFIFRAIKEKSKDNEELIWSDGGMFLNYPFGPMADKFGAENVLGLKLMSSTDLHELYNEQNGIEEIPDAPSNIFRVIWDLATTARDLALRLHVHESQWLHSIKIDIKNIKSTDFDITDEQKQILYDVGKKSVDEYLIKKIM